MVEEYETHLQQQRTLRAGIAALDERMRVLKATLESRLIDAVLAGTEGTTGISPRAAPIRS